jgi:SSS family solute:Na+ symporter
MHLTWIDWSIIIGPAMVLIVLAYRTNKYTKTTADFLAANRLANRYLLTMAEGMMVLSAAGCVAEWQMRYRTGFGASWWWTPTVPFALYLTLIGWVIYRYRQSRAMTMAQYFEMRYSRRFRILAGMICWGAGIVNYGIFPAMPANFFIHYCGLPQELSLLGMVVPTFVVLVVLLMTLALYFTFIGGQVSIIVTDFFQGLFCNAVLLILMVVVLVMFPLKEVFEGLQISQAGHSLVDPFDAGDIKGFNSWYFVIGLVLMVFNRIAWQGNQGYYCSAKSPHEAKMATVLGGFRFLFLTYAIMLMPLVAYMIMHHPNYTEQAAQVTEMLNQIDNEQVRDQMITPLTMTTYMPIGLMGAFGFVMLAAFISTNDTSLHAWGSIFVQDIVMPLRKKPLDTKKHLWLLRGSILMVGVFAIFWSTLFSQKLDIAMYFALTGAIWLGGAGVVIVGGLYTRWGTTTGAYAAMISGSGIAVVGLVLKYVEVSWIVDNKFLTGQWLYFWANTVAVILYVLFSLSGKRQRFNLDKMLHRGKYKIASDQVVGSSSSTSEKWTWKTALGITNEFTLGDKVIYGISIGQTILILVWFIVLTSIGVFIGLTPAQWSDYHRYFLWFWIVACFAIAFWLGIGGIRDAISFFRELKISRRDFSDDGTVTKENKIE